MNPNTCPHCGHTPALPLWGKSCLGPAASTVCRACGKHISVSWRALLFTLPLVIALGAAPLLASVAAGFALVAAAVALSTYLHWRFAPLVGK